MKASEVLRDSLAALDGGNAWTNDWPDAEAGELCALTAVERTTSHTKRPLQFLCKAAAIRTGGRVADMHFLIPQWNDAPERTWSDVEAAFLKAIELAEQDERELAR